MKKITILSILLSLIFLAGCANKTASTQLDNGQSQNSGLKICPDEWIDNQMPGDKSEEGRQYYILDGERRELKEFNTDWVQNNCNLEKQVVW